MVQMLPDKENHQGKISEMLGMSLGQGIGSGINTFFANRALDSVLKDKSLEGASPSTKMGQLQSALSPYGEKGQEIFKNRMMIEQQASQEKEQSKLKDEQEVIGKILSDQEVSPKELAKISPQNQLKVLDIQKRKQAGRSVKDSLIKAGYPEETANLWESQIVNSPTGGQSDVIKNVNDLIRRSGTGKGLQDKVDQDKTIKPNIEIPGLENETFELDFPELPEPIGLTPSDVVKQNEHREKINIPVYTETTDRLNKLDEEYRDISYLQELDSDPENLPSGLEKWNVDWETGDLKVKALATPEAQAYVKTIYRMLRNAKEFFPGRVTNFDLEQFRQGFPTLANSHEGRQLIAEQLSTANRIAFLRDETLKAAYDHYGSGADPILVKKYATENYRKLKNKLETKLKQTTERANSLSNQNQQNKTNIENAMTLEDLFP